MIEPDTQLAGQSTIYDHIPHARTTDPATSHHAAATLSDKHTMRRTLLLVFASHGQLSSEQACQLAGYGPQDGAWKRVSDLKVAGLVRPTGDTTVSSVGRTVDLLEITEEGRAVLNPR